MPSTLVLVHGFLHGSLVLEAAFPDDPTSVVALDASHSPFLSMPSEVADVIAHL